MNDDYIVKIKSRAIKLHDFVKFSTDWKNCISLAIDLEMSLHILNALYTIYGVTKNEYIDYLYNKFRQEDLLQDFETN